MACDAAAEYEYVFGAGGGRNLHLGLGAVLANPMIAPSYAAAAERVRNYLRLASRGGAHPVGAIYIGLHSGYAYGGTFHTRRLEALADSRPDAHYVPRPLRRRTVHGELSTYTSDTFARLATHRRGAESGGAAWDYATYIGAFRSEARAASVERRLQETDFNVSCANVPPYWRGRAGRAADVYWVYLLIRMAP